MLHLLNKLLSKRNDSIVLSYRALRRLIGIFGILLPFINIVGGWILTNSPVQSSISAYYYTNMRDFFVGLMFLVSIFLITYKGYNPVDLIVTTVTGIFGLGVALFPCYSDLYKNMRIGTFQLMPHTSDHIHITCAALFYILLAFNSIFLFTKTNKATITFEKKIRNFIYIASGTIILICLAGIFFIMILLTDEQLAQSKIILILETIALSFFGISWLVKGRTLFADKKVNIQLQKNTISA